MDHQTDPLLVANGLSLNYADSTAVNAVSLQVQRGEVLGLLGLNGAGKSSTLRMLAGILAPSKGEVLIEGRSMPESPLLAKRQIGYLPEIAPLYADMRVGDYLAYAGRLRQVPRTTLPGRISELLERLQLESFARRRIGNLSKGYRQRVGLAQVLVHDPDLLILDEPSSGLDPEQMREMRDLIRSLSPGKGIIFSSHLLGEVTELCDRVSVLHQGKLVYEGEIGDVNASTGRFIVRMSSQVDYAALLALSCVEEADIVATDTWAISAKPAQSAALLPKLVGAGFPVAEFAPERPSLETLFSSIVNACPVADGAPTMRASA